MHLEIVMVGATLETSQNAKKQEWLHNGLFPRVFSRNHTLAPVLTGAGSDVHTSYHTGIGLTAATLPTGLDKHVQQYGIGLWGAHW